MTLFHKYYSRKLQLAADVLAALEGAPEHTAPERALTELAIRYGMDPGLCGQVLRSLEEAELIRRDRAARSWSLVEDWAVPVPPPPLSAVESRYLQRILRLPQAELFLPEALKERLLEPGRDFPYDRLIQTLDPAGETIAPSLSQPEFRSILEGITRGCAISYRFRTREGEAAERTRAVPWRLEYSAYDNRWWLILYVPDQRRCVKAWLPNLRQIRLEPQIRVPESEILEAREALLMPEPIVLHVQDTRNTLERCFLVMERQQFLESRLHEDGSCTLRFRYYRYEESDMLRQLLYLGPGVTLVSPASLRQALLERVERALENFDVQPDHSL